MRYVASAFGLTAALLLQAPAAQAIPMTFIANLSGANERPDPVPSPGMGLATVILDLDLNTIEVRATFGGLTSPDQAAHIHCCAPLGTNSPVATRVPAFLNFPLGVTSGTYDMTFSLNDPDLYNPAFDGPTTAQKRDTLVGGIEAGMTYFNIHTVNFPGGEIRGQLLPAPEPASLVLLGSALLGLGLLRRRSRALCP